MAAVPAPQQPIPPPPPQHDAAPVQPRVQQMTCSSVLYDITEVISQVVIRVLFVAAHILMATTFLPLSWHHVAVPIAAIGSTFIAAFFFPKPQFSNNGIVQPIAHVFREAQLPENYPAGSPVGYRNHSANCSFNATAHLFDSIPQVAAWFRRPLGEGMNLQAFIHLLIHYQAPAAMIALFQEFIANRAAPQPSVREMYQEFMQNYQPQADDAFQADRVRGIFAAHEAFREFYRANDEAVQSRRAVSAGDSRQLRTALSRVNAMIEGEGQTSADFIATAVFDYLLPPELKMNIQRTLQLNMQNRPALQAPLQPVQESIGLFPIDIGNEAAPHFNTLLQNSCVSRNLQHLDRRDVNGDLTRYPIEQATVEFREAPPFLNFWIKRFRNIPPPDDYYNQILSYMHQNYPSISRYLLQRPTGWTVGKIDTPVEFPEVLTIPLQNGEQRQYRLRSYVTHLGADDWGHYVEGEERDGQKFFLNDSVSTWVQTPAHQENWNEQLRRAYLVCYVPVVPG